MQNLLGNKWNAILWVLHQGCRGSHHHPHISHGAPCRVMIDRLNGQMTFIVLHSFYILRLFQCLQVILIQISRQILMRWGVALFLHVATCLAWLLAILLDELYQVIVDEKCLAHLLWVFTGGKLNLGCWWTTRERTFFVKIQIAVVPLLILDSNLLKGLLLFLSEQLPTVSDGSHNLV